jgi:hypothetical protein
LLADDIPIDDSATSGEDEHDGDSAQRTAGDSNEDPLVVYGDAAYDAGELLARLEKAGASIHTKVQEPVAPHGRFTKDVLTIDLQARSLAPARSPSPCVRPHTSVTPRSRSSAPPAPDAHWPLNAPAHRLGARSPSAHTRPPVIDQVRGAGGPTPDGRLPLGDSRWAEGFLFSRARRRRTSM